MLPPRLSPKAAARARRFRSASTTSSAATDTDARELEPMTPVCPNCRTAWRPNSDGSCALCGEKPPGGSVSVRPRRRLCAVCGSFCGADDRFCRDCGAPVPAAEDQHAPSPPPASAQLGRERAGSRIPDSCPLTSRTEQTVPGGPTVPGRPRLGEAHHPTTLTRFRARTRLARWIRGLRPPPGSTPRQADRREEGGAFRWADSLGPESLTASWRSSPTIHRAH